MKIIKLIGNVTLCSVLTIGIMTLASSKVMAQPKVERDFEIVNTSIEIGIHKSEYVWVYKIIGDVKYKRLYNQTTGEWVGDWIKIS